MTGPEQPGAVDPLALSEALSRAGVAGLTIAWVDNNGIPRSRTVPVARVPEVAARGVGITALFAVFDSHDGITFAHEGLSNASGDVRLVPVLDQTTPLAGQPAFAEQDLTREQLRTVLSAMKETAAIAAAFRPFSADEYGSRACEMRRFASALGRR